MSNVDTLCHRLDVRDMTPRHVHVTANLIFIYHPANASRGAPNTIYCRGTAHIPAFTLYNHDQTVEGTPTENSQSTTTSVLHHIASPRITILSDFHRAPAATTAASASSRVRVYSFP